jgi:hypothetical protein
VSEARGVAFGVDGIRCHVCDNVAVRTSDGRPCTDIVQRDIRRHGALLLRSMTAPAHSLCSTPRPRVSLSVWQSQGLCAIDRVVLYARGEQKACNKWVCVGSKSCCTPFALPGRTVFGTHALRPGRAKGVQQDLEPTLTHTRSPATGAGTA